ncbi:MAG: 4Fe-4S binding protein, partial [Haliea sp.]|nr:4Fe-4S binding protein [Haliea sp.]
VIASECTGCDLCVEPCPVDCIDMLPLEESLQTWHWQLPAPRSNNLEIIATDSVTAERAA